MKCKVRIAPLARNLGFVGPNAMTKKGSRYKGENEVKYMISMTRNLSHFYSRMAGHCGHSVGDLASRALTGLVSLDEIDSARGDLMGG
jgi:hypothetical protein